MTDKQDWKHGAWFYIEEPEAIAVFDDEDLECDSIYMRRGDKFIPCRTVLRTNKDHWKNVLLAWACRAPLEDFRNDKTNPLP